MHSRQIFAAAFLCVSSIPALAQQPAALPAPAASEEQARPTTLSAPVAGGYVVSGGGKGDWGFMMGPNGAPNMQMKLIRANLDRSGAVGFVCSRATGEMGLALLLPGMTYEVGKPRDIKLTVGDRENKIRVEVRQVPQKGHDPVIETGGLAVPDILKAMGEVPDDRADARLKFDDGAGHSVSFGLTKPHGVASEASQICSSWALATVRDHGGPATSHDLQGGAAEPGRGKMLLPGATVDTGAINGAQPADAAGTPITPPRP